MAVTQSSTNLRGTDVGELVEKRVRGGVVTLSHVAAHARDGSEANEVAEGNVGSGEVEVDSANGLGIKDPGKVCGILAEQVVIGDDAGRVDHTRQVLRKLFDDSLNRR